MKVAIASDVHLEFGSLELQNPGEVDVLILSGDILVENDLDEWNEEQANNGFSRNRSVMYHRFFQTCSKQFPHVIYVAGNHEHYHGDFKYTLSGLKRKLAYLENVHVLDKEVFDIGDYRFIGGTLWTDMNKEDPLTMHSISGVMNDYKQVKNSDRMVYRKVPIYEKDDDGKYKLEEVGPGHQRMIEVGMKMREEVARFSPQDSVDDHRKMLDYIRVVYEDTPPWVTTIVVGHHAPSKSSTHPRYKDEVMMNGAYSSDLSEFIMDRPGIKLWTHGHTHEDFDYMIKSCRVVCNPRGYINYEDRADRFQLKVVEV